VQLGTVNFYNPTVSMQILDALPSALQELSAGCIQDIVGTLQT
jgi:dihydroorotate dehydrogenase (NAD+) catalytic subunit